MQTRELGPCNVTWDQIKMCVPISMASRYRYLDSD